MIDVLHLEGIEESNLVYGLIKHIPKMMPKCWLLNEWWDYMIKQILTINKARNYRKVLADLTEWFEYQKQEKLYNAKQQDAVFTAYAKGSGGFISLKETSPVTAEIFCMGAIKTS